MFNIGMENKPYEYTIKHDGIRAPYVRPILYNFLACPSRTDVVLVQ